MKKTLLLLFAGIVIHFTAFSQALDFSAVKASVDFSRTLQEWDGFGFNYVETAHSSDMQEFKQEYGGFSLLDEQEKSETAVIAFASNGTENPDTLVLTNLNKNAQLIAVEVKGSSAEAFTAFRTTKSPQSALDEVQEKCKTLGTFELKDGILVYDAPAGSVTTFYSK